MLKYFVVSAFLMIFAYLIRKDRIYVIPMILIVYSNINGLLDWEDFALKGVIKFPDYGLLLTLTIIFLSVFSVRKSEPAYVNDVRKAPLFNAINALWFYYLLLFIFSVAIQGMIWPIKMARTFFYGLVFYVIYKEFLVAPLAKFEKVINCLLASTYIFGLLYIGYNVFGWDIYGKEEYEHMDMGFLTGDVKRNFAGFPMFGYYFILLFIDRLMQGRGSKLLNLGGLMILLLCVLLMLTRGTLILTIVAGGFLMLYRRPTPAVMTRLVLLGVAIAVAVPLAMVFAEGHYLAMMQRFDEFSKTGITGSSNFLVRANEFNLIVKNVMDFDPLFGFGFTVPYGLGYQTSVLHGGSPDNGYSNLIGTTGFFGLAAFLVMIVCWFQTNIKLQALNAEKYSRVNFVFIIFMLGSFLNGASFSYIFNFCLIMAYDLFAYAYIKFEKTVAPNMSPPDKTRIAISR